MRATLVAAALALVVRLPAAQVPAGYAQLVERYQAGDSEGAVTQLAALDTQTIQSGFTALMVNPPARLVAAAAAMHTELAVRLSPRDFFLSDRHLRMATSIVEVGMPAKLKRNGSVALKPALVPAVTPEFRRVWYLVVTNAMEGAGRYPTAEAYLENARILFPHDAEILLMSGIAAEMRGSDRESRSSDGDRRTAFGHAEVYLRASRALAPDQPGTRLRLGRVLQLRGQAGEAREVLTAVADQSDKRLSYLASLFLGGLEDAAGNTAAAAQWYERASGTFPSSQAARLAANELRHRAGERHEAAAASPSAIGTGNSDDPWWSYHLGEYLRINVYLPAMRKASQS
jgi:tetratricopeptide (TPR) repeat protein